MKSKSVSQYDVINALRLPLIVLVTYGHSYGGVKEGYSILGSGWDSYEVLKIVMSQTLVKMAMPTFFVMVWSIITKPMAKIIYSQVLIGLLQKSIPSVLLQV